MSERKIRVPIVAANWKMNLLAASAEEVCRTVASELGESTAEVVVFPGHVLIPAAAAELRGSRIAWGGQDLHPDDDGAHTGDVSGPQLADAGCTWALVGHSERRQDHGESDGLVARKVAAALRNDLAPLVCVGETAAERDAGRTLEIVSRQLELALAPIVEAGDPPPPFAIAYEPVWAIGTGHTATPAIAQEVQAAIRGRIKAHFGHEVSEATRILYGGSVKPDNAAELAEQEDVDGFLVGGSSLDAEEFLAIIGCC